MALNALRLRRTFSVSSSFIRTCWSSSSIASPLSQSCSYTLRNLNSPAQLPSSSSSFKTFSQSLRFDFAQSRSFASYNNNNDDDKISPDTILFEGCDYNHWLITMDFPKDPKPTPEEMVETYVQTLAKVVGRYVDSSCCYFTACFIADRYLFSLYSGKCFSFLVVVVHPY